MTRYRAVQCVLLLLLVQTLPAVAGNVTVQLACRAESKCDVTGDLVLQSTSDKTVSRRLQIGADSRVTFDELPGSSWDVALDAKGFWAATTPLTVAPGESAVTLLDVWPTGHVRIRVSTPTGPVTELRAVVTVPPGTREAVAVPDGTSFNCAAVGGGSWTCELPAAAVDVSLRAVGFAPHYAWDVRVPLNRFLDLGAVSLKKGGSLVAWLDSGTAKQLIAPATAVLRHRVSGASTTNTARLLAPVARATFTPKGMAQLAPLAPGQYVLEVQSDGFAPARLQVEAAEGRELIVRRPIELFAMVNARLRLKPQISSDGSAWQVSTWHPVEFGSGWEPAGSGPVSPDGTFELRNQSAGPIRVVVRDTSRNKVASREFVLADGSEHVIDLDLASLSGSVTLGKEPLPNAQLSFGTGSEKISTLADENAKFVVTLPRRGKWHVEGKVPDLSVYGTNELEIGVSDDVVSVEFPDTELSGWVVDQNGERVGMAEVTLITQRSARALRAKPDGTFRFRGIPHGKATLRSEDTAKRLSSRMIQVVVPEEGALSNMIVTLENVHRLEGLLRSGGNPVVGARVDGYAVAGLLSRQQRTTTDMTGSFAFDAPESASTFLLIVSAPGRVLQSFKVPITGEPVSLDIAPRGGTVFLRWPRDANPLRVLSNDVLTPITDLWDWARAHGELVKEESILVPHVAPGKYKFCSQDKCVEGTLAIGGRLDLDLTRVAGAP